MRFFSLVPAVLLAVTSFTAAAPATTSTSDSTAIPGDGSTRAAIDTVYITIDDLQNLTNRLSNVSEASPINPDQLNSVLSDIATTITTACGSLENDISPTSPYLAEMETSMTTLISTLNLVTLQLVPIVKQISNNGTTDTITLVSNVLIASRSLASFLQQLVPSSLGSVFNPLLDFVFDILDQVGAVMGPNSGTN